MDYRNVIILIIHVPVQLSSFIIVRFLLLIDMESDYSRVRVYERNMTTSQFMSLCSLCTDHALLGQHLLSMSKSLSGSDNPTGDCKRTNNYYYYFYFYFFYSSDGAGRVIDTISRLLHFGLFC